MKKIFAFLLTVTIFLAGCASAQSSEICTEDLLNAKHMFVVTATGTERKAIEGKVEVVDTCVYDQTIYTLAKIHGREIVIFSTYVGPRQAKLTAHYTIEAFGTEDIEGFVFSGIAGGLDPDLKIGDVTAPAKFVDLTSGDSVGVSESYLEIASAMSINFPENGATSETFIDKEEDAQKIRDTFGSSIVDMETYWIALEAKAHDIPFIAFRTVSDYASGHDKSHYQDAANASADATVVFLDLYFSQTTP